MTKLFLKQVPEPCEIYIYYNSIWSGEINQNLNIVVIIILVFTLLM